MSLSHRIPNRNLFASLLVFLVILITAFFFSNFTGNAKKLVVIHYANETDPQDRAAQNYDRLIDLLLKMDDPKAERIAKNLQREPELFQNALALERRQLKRLPEVSGNLIYCEVDNRKTRDGYFAYCDSESESFQRVPLTPPNTDDYILADSPLATPQGLRVALKKISEKFPPAKFDFLLISKSHGNQDLALTVKLSRKFDDLSDEDLQGLLTGDQPETNLPVIGTSKSEYFKVLSEFGSNQQMNFRAVVMESCKGVFDEELAQLMPKNVEVVYASGNRNLEFQTIPYEAIVEKATTPALLVSGLHEALDDDFLRLKRQTSFNYWVLLCFLPIAYIVLRKLLRTVTVRQE